MFTTDELTKNVKNHLVSLKLIKPYDETDITEKFLIESRSSSSLSESSKICLHHRHFYGINWRPLKSCTHPDHIISKSSALRAATLNQISYLQNKFPEHNFPMGCQLCARHVCVVNENTKET